MIIRDGTIKDIFAVAGMPTGAGSRLDLADQIGAEGQIVQRLRSSGAVIIGKCRSIEFAAGAQNVTHPTPWNPADPDRHRSPGGSSNGSATAVAAGFVPLAIGTDTGGSVRAPAALCGVVGHKYSAGSVPLDGLLPLSPRLDSLGTFTLCVRDAETAFAQLTAKGTTASHQRRAMESTPISACRIGVVLDDMLAGIDDEISDAFHLAIARLTEAGADIVPLDWPRADEMAIIADVFARLVPSDLITTLGVDRLCAENHRIDPVAVDRLSHARSLSDAEYACLAETLNHLARATADRMSGLDALIYPTTPCQAWPVDALTTAEAAIGFTRRVLSLTRVTNALGLTACSVPLPRASGSLPIGIDIATKGGEDPQCLRIASAVLEALSTNPTR